MTGHTCQHCRERVATHTFVRSWRRRIIERYCVECLGWARHAEEAA